MSSGFPPVVHQLSPGYPLLVHKVIHTAPSDVHTAYTPPVDKKWAANWGNDVFPTIHRPYDYDVPITK